MPPDHIRGLFKALVSLLDYMAEALRTLERHPPPEWRPPPGKEAEGAAAFIRVPSRSTCKHPAG